MSKDVESILKEYIARSLRAEAKGTNSAIAFARNNSGSEEERLVAENPELADKIIGELRAAAKSNGSKAGAKTKIKQRAEEIGIPVVTTYTSQAPVTVESSIESKPVVEEFSPAARAAALAAQKQQAPVLNSAAVTVEEAPKDSKLEEIAEKVKKFLHAYKTAEGIGRRALDNFRRKNKELMQEMKGYKKECPELFNPNNSKKDSNPDFKPYSRGDGYEDLDATANSLAERIKSEFDAKDKYTLKGVFDNLNHRLENYSNLESAIISPITDFGSQNKRATDLLKDIRKLDPGLFKELHEYAFDLRELQTELAGNEEKLPAAKVALKSGPRKPGRTAPDEVRIAR